MGINLPPSFVKSVAHPIPIKIGLMDNLDKKECLDSQQCHLVHAACPVMAFTDLI